MLIALTCVNERRNGTLDFHPKGTPMLRHGLLQRHAHSPVIEQGRADIARRRKRGAHYLSSDPGRTAPSIWPDVIYGRHRPIPDVTSTALPDHRHRLFLGPEWGP